MQIPFLRCVVCYILALAAITAAAQTPRFEVVAKGLEHPWAVAFIGDGQMLVTERPGRLRVVAANGVQGQPVQG
jgi:glucose/arabinose dehydrogenase